MSCITHTIGESKTKIRDCYPLISTIAILISLVPSQITLQ